MSRLLDEVRDMMGTVPRWRGFFGHLSLRQARPIWIKRSDELNEVFRRQGKLMREGDIVWGALVQANMHLFSPGPHDHPAMVIHSPDPFFEDDPNRLRALGNRLFQLKNTTPASPDERRLAEMITDEMERGMGWTVPRACTGAREVTSTSVIVFRRHLPDRVLRCGWFPLLTHPETPAVMIVPSNYRPDELVEIWMEGG